MPMVLAWHSSFTLGNDLIVIGGNTGQYRSSSIYKLTLNFWAFEQSTWEELEMKLQTARSDFVADVTYIF